MAVKKVTNHEKASIKSVLAKLDDGTVQITFTIPFFAVQKAREKALSELAQKVELPGFRKGKAPTERVAEKIDTQKLFEQTLQNLLPEQWIRAVSEYKLNPVLHPKFELISVEEGKDWSIRAITCELPRVNLDGVKDKISATKGADIWVPGKDKVNKAPTKEEKEQQIIKTLLETIEIKIPSLLIQEEVNHKLSQLLDQVQKLGISVEQYLSSTGKTIEQVRQDYAKQSTESIKLVLILNETAHAEKIQIEETEIDAVINASKDSGADDKPTNERKSLIKAILSRRKALDYLVSLA